MFSVNKIFLHSQWHKLPIVILFFYIRAKNIEEFLKYHISSSFCWCRFTNSFYYCTYLIRVWRLTFQIRKDMKLCVKRLDTKYLCACRIILQYTEGNRRMIPVSSMHYPAVCPYFHPASPELIPCYQTKEEESLHTKRDNEIGFYCISSFFAGFFVKFKTDQENVPS